MAVSAARSATTASSRAARHCEQAEPGELGQVHLGIVLAHHPPPQQCGKGAGVGEVGADVHAEQYRQDSSGPCGSGQGQLHQHGGQVVDDVRKRGGQRRDVQQGRQPGTARDQMTQRRGEPVAGYRADHDAQRQDEREEGNRCRAHDGCGGGAAPGQGPGGKHDRASEGRPRGVDPECGGQDIARERARHRGQREHRHPGRWPLAVASGVPGRLRRAPGRRQRAAGRRRNGRPRRRGRLRWCHRRPRRAASRRRASRAAPGTRPR